MGLGLRLCVYIGLWMGVDVGGDDGRGQDQRRKSKLVRYVAWLGLLLHVLCVYRHVVIDKGWETTFRTSVCKQSFTETLND